MSDRYHDWGTAIPAATVLSLIGGSGSVWADYKAACELFPRHDVIVINDMIAEFPGRIKYVASLHPSKLSGWLNQREYRKYNTPLKVWCISKVSGVTDTLLDNWHGSSGLYAVKVGLEMGYNKIILCGVPMTESNHFLRQRPWKTCRQFLPKWIQYRAQLDSKVRSMSGFTRDLLGAPTQEWLCS